MTNLDIFLSHHHEEKRLATAWQTLIQMLTMGVVTPWYSSDERASGGARPGEWRDEIQNEIGKANTILVLITPVSNEKPWLFYESGLGRGQNKELIPVSYFMKTDAVNSVFKSYQCYQGDMEEGANGIRALCRKLMFKHLGREIPAQAETPWASWIGRYLETVREEKESSLTRTLFHDHFHDSTAAERLAGDWFAKWTQIHHDNSEEQFEADTLLIWTTETRLRIVGQSNKEGREILSIKGQQAARYYPMEGVVSRAGWVALSYWSGGNIPICGTALLIPKGLTGELLDGTWQGYTAKSINAAPKFTNGRVVIARRQEVVENYWPELKGPDRGPQP